MADSTHTQDLRGKLKHLFSDLVDEHFPKGECEERGQAMMLVSMAILQIEEMVDLLAATRNKVLDEVEDALLDNSIALKNEETAVKWDEVVATLTALRKEK